MCTGSSESKNNRKCAHFNYCSISYCIICRFPVSRCVAHSKREKYVDELRKYISVDVFGSCGTLACTRNDLRCDKLIEQQYYFYLAFENSVCVGYITEKYWQRVLVNVVPVVLKRSLYTNNVPPNSFVAVDDFPNAKSLADYLKYLIKHPAEYMQYFNWKQDYEIITYNFWQSTYEESANDEVGFCKLCKIIMNGVHKQYDVQEWWHGQGRCDGDHLLKYITM